MRDRDEPKGQQTKVVVSRVVRNVAVDDDKFLFVGLVEAREWRSRRGRNGKRKIAIGHRSMAQLSSSRLIPAGPAHPEKSPVPRVRVAGLT